MKNGIGLKIGMVGIILVPLHPCIFNNHNRSQVFVQAKANATSILIATNIGYPKYNAFIHPFAMLIVDYNIGIVAHTAVCRALSGTLRTPAAVI